MRTLYFGTMNLGDEVFFFAKTKHRVMQLMMEYLDEDEQAYVYRSNKLYDAEKVDDLNAVTMPAEHLIAKVAPEPVGVHESFVFGNWPRAMNRKTVHGFVDHWEQLHVLMLVNPVYGQIAQPAPVLSEGEILSVTEALEYAKDCAIQDAEYHDIEISIEGNKQLHKIEDALEIMLKYQNQTSDTR